MKEKTKVLFRVWTGKERTGDDVIAIFPRIPGDSSPYTCQSYEHVGQHGACDPTGCIRITRAAKPSEYRALAAELRRIGYRLDIRQRTGLADRLIIRRELSGVTVSGEYSRQGYTVTTQRHGVVVDSYTAGANRRDSTQPANGATITLNNSRAYCLKTCREIAKEKNGTFTGVERVSESEI